MFDITVINSFFTFFVIFSLAVLLFFYFNKDKRGLDYEIKNIGKIKGKRAIFDLPNKNSMYKRLIVFQSMYDVTLAKHFILLKLDESVIDSYYKNIFIFSLAFSMLISSVCSYVLGAMMTIPFLFIAYIVGNYIYYYKLENDVKKYKIGLSNEVVELFLVFHLLYPTYRNPDDTLKKIIASNKEAEISRQMEHMLLLVSEKGLDKGVEYMTESVEGVVGLDIFIELYYNLKREGIKALQNINSYIGNIINSKELMAEKRINETKARVDLIMVAFIFIGLVVLILSPMLLGRFDGEHSLIDYLHFAG